MKKIRLDELLMAQGLVENKETAFIKVTEGKIFVDGQKAISPAQPVSPNARIELKGENRYVGRAAHKLVAALDAFDIDPKGKICADIGAATGGFTEVLLERGAAKVYAIDTARGKFAYRLRNNPRVVLMEETDARSVVLPERVSLVTIDVSLISLGNILPAVRERALADGGEVIALFKPQYEASREPELLHHGIVWDDAAREKLLAHFRVWASRNKWHIKKIIESPIRGSKGNKEFLLWLVISK